MRHNGTALKFKVHFFILICVAMCTQCYHHNTKRALLFSQIFVLQLTGCVTVPSTLPRRNFFLNMCVQGNYMAISNISQLTPIEIAASARSNSNYSFNKPELYLHIEDWMNGHGLKGENCLLRTICETANIPFDTENDNSLLENIFHYILTPSEDTMHINISNIDEKYVEAEKIGKVSNNCKELYPGCNFAILEYISNIFF